LTYKDALCQAMRDLAKDPLVIFIGYGINCGAQAGGTFKGIPKDQLLETPVAENLMAGLAIGLALKGRRPVLWIERIDFILNALDSLVNHLDKIAEISAGDFKPAIIIRAAVGNKSKPIFSGPTHVQDFSEALEKMLNLSIVVLNEAAGIIPAYECARANLIGDRSYKTVSGDVIAAEKKPLSTMLIEKMDLM
jgi:pyruvate/2-oxoglutarate/acetoin dehydrogenase E1 component